MLSNLLKSQFRAQKSFSQIVYRFCADAQKHTQIEILRSESNDINFNLATEEFLYEHSTLAHPVLFLWRNDRTIVIGRHQNPWKECFLQNMERDGINLARRKTGGGAVYQDLGNSVFSFLYPAKDDKFPLDVSKKINNSILVSALKNLGIEAEVSGRNDILCGGKKISGSAYKVNLGNKDGEGRKALHHGTMLLNLQSQDLQNYLNPNKEKLKSKGVDSVISRVMNLIEIKPEITHEMFCEEVEKEFIAHYKNAEVTKRSLSKSELEKNDKINNIYQNSISWDWLHGQTPKFSNSIEKRFTWGIFDFNCDVSNSYIQKSQVYSDCLYADYISTINEHLEESEGKYIYDTNGMRQLCTDIREKVSGNEIFVQFTNDVEEWIVEAI